MPSNKKLLQAAAGNAGESLYAEDVFSTYLYDGNGSTQTITNGIDLDGEGGLVWLKRRDNPGYGVDHVLIDNERGVSKILYSNSTSAEGTTTWSTSFNSDGFNFTTASGYVNASSGDYASWTFRKAEKFFDVVTYTGDGVAGRTVAHNLGSVPGCIIVKKLNAADQWAVQHKSLTATHNLILERTDAATDDDAYWYDIEPTSTEFTVGYDGGTNGNGSSYVAYLFASDAGGFGDDGSESIIKCGSYTGNGGSQEINLGFEPQWLMIKKSSATGSWQMIDTMRGMPVDAGSTKYLLADSSIAEYGSGAEYQAQPTATGFKLGLSNDVNQSGVDFIYIAIRRPMKTPESGAEVFTAVSQNTNTSAVTSGFPVDMVIMGDLPTTWGYNWSVSDRLRGGSNVLFTSSTAAENTGSNTTLDSNTGLTNGWVSGGTTGLFQMFKRATGFFDVVAYSGNGAASQTLNHNLGVTPDIITVKKRSASGSQWPILVRPIAESMYLNTTNAAFGAYYYIDNPTSTTFDVQTDGSAPQSNQSGETYIAYLFATLAGVSKVGSYTGTGTTNNIDCGFSSSARFVMVKRTSSTGDWYVWDSARGITVGSDPFLKLNTTDAEGTTSDIIQPYSSGFTLTSNAGTAINGNGETFIFLAIA